MTRETSGGEDLGFLKALATRTPTFLVHQGFPYEELHGSERSCLPVGSPVQKPPPVLVRTPVVVVLCWLIQKGSGSSASGDYVLP
jgi:hypothetical protein